MKTTGENTVYNGNFIQCKQVDIIRPDGQPGIWEMVSRTGEGSAVSALVENVDTDCFVLVEQYRVPVQKRVLELVAGICDKPGISKEQVVAEEIIEETGYVAQSVEFIMSGPNSAGLTDEINYSYYAQVSGIKGDQCLEASEDIQVIEVPKKDINSFIESKIQEGVLISPAISAVLYKLLTSGKINIQ